MDYGKWAFKNSKLVYFMLAVLMVGGLLFAFKMSKLEDPKITVKQAMVVAIYPGASAHDIELEVCDPLEKAIRTIAELDNVNSYVFNDMALLKVELLSTTPDSQIEQVWDMLRRRVNDVQRSIPSGATLAVKDDFGLVYGIFYALSGDGISERELSDYAKLFSREIGNVEGVARVEIYGDRSECININLQPEKMATLGVSPVEVIMTLNGQNGTYYSGYYNNGPYRIRVAVADKSRAIEQICSIVIQGHEKDQLRLADIADVSDTYEDLIRNAMYDNGKYAVGIAIAGRDGTDIVKVGAAVEKKVKEMMESRIPAGVDCNKVFYQPKLVSDALTTFLVNLLESVLLVIAVLMFTMGLKSSLIIGISLVFIVVGSFVFLGLAGGTMQRVSLGAFILAMGMLVDNAIVIVDGILIDLKRGKSYEDAFTDIGKKTAMPLLGATLIAIMAFLPVYLSPDTSGVYIRDLFIVLAVSLLLSWILALVHVPLMCKRYLIDWASEKSRKKLVSNNSSNGELYSGKAYDMLRKAILFGMRNRWLSIGIAVVLVALSAMGYGMLKHGFFPDMVYDQLYMEYKLPEGSSSKQVIKDLAEIEEYLHTRPEITSVVTSIGGAPARYNLVRSMPIPSMSYGELIINFKDPDALVENIDEIQKELSIRYPSAYVKLKRYNIMYKNYPIEVQFCGPDPAVLHELSDKAMEIMERSDDVYLVTTDWDPRVPYLSVEYDQVAARRAGVSRQDVALSMMTAGGGLPIGTFYEGLHKNTIYIKCVDDNGGDIDNMRNVPVFSITPNIGMLSESELKVKFASGTLQLSEVVEALLSTYPVEDVAKGIDVKWEDPVVRRYNNQRSQSVMCSPVRGLETEAARSAIAQEIEAIPLPVGYTMHWEGEKAASDRTMHYIFMYFPLGIVLIIFLLILLFKDYKKPIILICNIPLLLIGIVWAMYLCGMTFTFCSVVGALGLIGMMMKNGIVMLDEVKRLEDSGMDTASAVTQGAVSRFRPVLMASVTTILGMIPLLSDAMFGPMAATIMGGLLFSTFAILYFLPVLYVTFFKVEVK